MTPPYICIFRFKQKRRILFVHSVKIYFFR